MNTRGFNFVDKLVARWRLGRVKNLINNGDKVLDFGCGSQGYLLRVVKRKIGFGLGLDADVANIKEGNLVFRKFRFGRKLGFGKMKFDKVVMLAVLEHIYEDEVVNLFEEFAKILVFEGKVIMTTPTIWAKPVLETLAKLGILNKEEIFDHKKYWNKNNLIDLANKTGFEMISYKLFQFGYNSEIVFQKN